MAGPTNLTYFSWARSIWLSQTSGTLPMINERISTYYYNLAWAEDNIKRKTQEHQTSERLILFINLTLIRQLLRVRLCKKIVTVHGCGWLHTEGKSSPTPNMKPAAWKPLVRLLAFLSKKPHRKVTELSLLSSVGVRPTKHSLHMRTDDCIQFLYSLM